jgi:mRNA interferase YafQ
LKLIYTTQFKKDYKKIKKQQKIISKLTVVIEKLLGQEKLEPKYKDHSLSGKYQSHRDCHIEPDWILIYRITKDELILERTGSHSDLFR